ncbi:oxidoreductase domain-containing protein [Decorospora gaudefroyi]|uniref:D-xylose 1-dehydrogenase (NADP(+), D-xylono-1,5-lactone-forming) n=1 Tax=Decorospora gaudefroyi TaxID=184978 RepID=A0A6A5KGE3_9PLEO|nr:oxidoreductase domain-containing protein [Decorospora gaudefroyi]
MGIVQWMNSIAEFGEWAAGRKPVTKKEDALRFGILGAANIAPVALIIPARSHADVIVVAVAARDRKKAETYAKRWGIPIVHDSYDALINDPSIDCIYNPLPNGLHYRYTLAALKAGKHVLLEKPSLSNAEEARSLFHHSVLSAPKAPVLLEASHYRFHPAWRLFRAQFNKEDAEDVESRAGLFAGAFDSSDIRWNYDLAGGATMDLGHYALSALRGAFGTEPTKVTSATARLRDPPYDRCDEAMTATYTFPNGGRGRMSADLGTRGGYWFPWLTSRWPSFRDCLASVTVRTQPQALGSENGLEKSEQKMVKFTNFMGPHGWHRIAVTTTTTLSDPTSGNPVKKTRSTEKKTAYTFPEVTASKGEEWWSTYRYMLEEFVNKVKGREGSGAWIDGEESIRQMEANDRTYEKAGMLVRPTCKELE